MAKTPLSLVGNRPGTSLEPPATLGEAGAKLWRDIAREFSFDDAAGQALLLQACTMQDRAEALRREVENDGPVIRTRTGVVKTHPAVNGEIACRAFITKAFTKLGLLYEPVRTTPGRPPGAGA
jgi:hypothetical protein